MNTGNRRRNQAQQPPPPESEQISSEDGYLPAEIIELDPKNDFNLDDVEQLVDEKLSAAVASAPPIKVQLVGRTRVQLVEKSTPRAKTQSPSQPTEDQIQALMGDVSKLSDTEKKLRRYTVIKHREQWKKAQPGRVKTASENDPLYEKEVGVAHHHVSTWRRALGRKK